MGVVTVTWFQGAKYSYDCSVPHFDWQVEDYFTQSSF